MKKTIKLLKDYGKYKAGEVMLASEEGAKTLIADGTAEEYTPEFQVEKLEDDIQKRIDAVLDEFQNKANEIRIPATARDTDEELKGGFANFGEFAMHVYKSSESGAAITEKLHSYLNMVKATGMSEGINADGGFLIPTEFSTALLMALSQTATIAPRCTNFPINNNIELPFVNLTSQATSWTGGITIYKPDEAGSKTSSKPALAKAKLKLYKMIALVYATDELLADSPIALQTFLTTMVSTEIALTRDEDIINGTGAGEALGVMNSPCMISVAKETGQAAATIVYDNVLKMWMRLWSLGRPRAVWLINQDCMQQIMKMSVAVGTGGAPVIVMNATTALPQTIFGAPIIWSPHSQTLGTAGDIILGDFSQYITSTKAGRGIETATSIHLKFDYDETAFRFVFRCDGQPWWSSAVTPKHGTSTVSPFVSLATRA